MMQRPVWLSAVLLTALFALGAVSGALGQESPGGGTNLESELAQQTCPVMVGSKIDPNIYTDYRGKRVYFCCQKCKAAFEANPEKYLARLPQFAAGQAEASKRSGFRPGKFVEPFGVTTLSLLFVTFGLGFFMKRNPKVLLKWHKRSAYVTIIVASCHATLVMLAHNP
jgi:YHS domain-containing protein